MEWSRNRDEKSFLIQNHNTGHLSRVRIFSKEFSDRGLDWFSCILRT